MPTGNCQTKTEGRQWSSERLLVWSLSRLRMGNLRRPSRPGGIALLGTCSSNTADTQRQIEKSLACTPSCKHPRWTDSPRKCKQSRRVCTCTARPLLSPLPQICTQFIASGFVTVRYTTACRPTARLGCTLSNFLREAFRHCLRPLGSVCRSSSKTSQPALSGCPRLAKYV